MKEFWAKKFFLCLAIASFFITLTFFAGRPVFATPNLQINYQGKLTNSSNVAVSDGGYSIVFSLYTASSGGTAIWTESQTATVTNGLFSVMLGSSSSLSGVNFNQTLYLGVNVASDGEMTPRKVFGTVPAAFASTFVSGSTSTPSSFGTTTPISNTQVTIEATSTTAIPLNIRASSGQAANLFQIQDASASSLFTISSSGQVSAPYFTATSTTATSTFAGAFGVSTTTPWGRFSLELDTYNPALVVSNQGSSTPTFWIGGVNQNGNIGVGTSTPNEKLALYDGSFFQSPGNPKLVGSITSLVADMNDVAIQGKYLYAISGSSRFYVYDVSNPSFPTLTGSSTSFGGDALFVAGRYVYVASSSSQSLRIVDVSNPSQPTSVSTLTLNNGVSPFDLVVSGRHIYIAGDGGVSIVDVSNPAKPKEVAFNMLGGSVSIGEQLSVQGNYLYVWDSDNDSITIVDVSNPTSPVVSTFISTDSRATVSGRYLYSADPTSQQFRVYDISNPVSPTLVGSLAGAVSATVYAGDIVVAGRYVYLADPGNDTIKVFDVASSTAPVLVGSTSVTGTDSLALSVAGRYAYVLNDNSAATTNLSVFDLSGIEITSATAHSLEAGGLQVRESAAIQGSLSIGTSLQVGTGGIFSAGPIAVGVASSTQTGAISATFQGRVSIGTSTPSAKVTIWGEGTGSTPNFIISDNASTTLFTVLDNGNIGVGTTSPYAKLSVVGQVVGSYFTATSTTATSTFAGAISLPSTLSTGTGVLTVNGSRFLHSYGTESVFLGTEAGNLTLSGPGQNVGIGYQALDSLTTGFQNVAIGRGALSDITTHQANTAIGTGAMGGFTGSSGVAVGLSALSSSSGDNNIAIGSSALSSNSGTGNIGIGNSAFNTGNTGSNNLGLGVNTLSSNSGSWNIAAHGLVASLGNSGSYNIALGEGSLSTTGTQSGSYNIAVGAGALNANTSGASSTAIGYYALGSNTTGASSTAVGINAGRINTTGSKLTFLGTNAGYTGSSNGLTNATAIGYNAQVTASNSLILGSTGADAVNVGVGTTSPYARLSLELDTQNPAFIVANQGSSTPSFYIGGVNQNGRIGIGTASPTAALTLKGDLTFPEAETTYNIGVDDDTLDANGGSLTVSAGDSPSGTGGSLYLSAGTGIFPGKVVINSSGANTGIATSSPWRTLSVTGTVGFDGLTSTSTPGNSLCLSNLNEVTLRTAAACNAASSLRFKQNISTLTSNSGLAEVLALNPVSFHYTPEYLGSFINDPNWNTEYVGFIAEEVQSVDPRLITTNDLGQPETVRYEHMSAVLTKAIQELNAKLDTAISNGQINGYVGNNNNFDPNNLQILRQAAGNWSLDEAGRLVVKEVKTDRLCVGEVCVDEAGFRSILENAGINQVVVPPPPPAEVPPTDEGETTGEDLPAEPETQTTVPDEEVFPLPPEPPADPPPTNLPA